MEPESGLALKIPVFVSLSIALIALATVPLAMDRRAPRSEITCSSFSGKGNTPYNVLVVGESWARGNRILPDLEQSLSQRLGGRSVKACAIAFSGYNTHKVLRGLQHEINAGHVEHLFGELPADSVLVLTGVNDQIQHVGPGAYAKGTAQIVGLFPTSRVQVIGAPFVRPVGLDLAPQFKIKNNLQRFFYDKGKDDVRARYTAVAAELHPRVKVIPYQAFMPAFDGSRYTRDGIHLTNATFAQYGAFLGSHVDTGTAQQIAASSVPAQ